MPPIIAPAVAPSGKSFVMFCPIAPPIIAPKSVSPVLSPETFLSEQTSTVYGVLLITVLK